MEDGRRISRRAPLGICDRLRRRRATCVPSAKVLAPYGEQILDCFSAGGAMLTVEEIGSITSLQPTVESLAYILVMLRCLVEDGSGRYRRMGRLPDGWILTAAGGVS